MTFIPHLSTNKRLSVLKAFTNQRSFKKSAGGTCGAGHCLYGNNIITKIALSVCLFLSVTFSILPLLSVLQLFSLPAVSFSFLLLFFHFNIFLNAPSIFLLHIFIFPNILFLLFSPFFSSHPPHG